MSTNRHLILASAGMVIVLALVVGLFIAPNYRQAAAMQREIASLQGRIAGLQTQEHVLNELNARNAAARQRVDNELKTIPEAPDLASLIRQLSQEVDRVAVLDQTFTAGSACEALSESTKDRKTESSKQSPTNRPEAPTGSDQKSVMAMPLTVDMEARFDSVFALVRQAESMDRLIRVSSVRLMADATKSAERSWRRESSPLLKATVGLEAIYLADAETTAK